MQIIKHVDTAYRGKQKFVLIQLSNDLIHFYAMPIDQCGDYHKNIVEQWCRDNRFEPTARNEEGAIHEAANSAGATMAVAGGGYFQITGSIIAAEKWALRHRIS